MKKYIDSYEGFFPRDTEYPFRGVVTAQEWEQNPDTGIDRLLENYRADNAMKKVPRSKMQKEKKTSI